jgi:predicted transcriptional regulator
VSKLIPLKPIGKEDIRKLEGALLTMVLYSQETLEMIRNPHERVTWIDSLYVAAASLAREKAGIPISKIAEELGITEASVRRTFKGREQSR